MKQNIVYHNSPNLELFKFYLIFLLKMKCEGILGTERELSRLSERTLPVVLADPDEVE